MEEKKWSPDWGKAVSHLPLWTQPGPPGYGWLPRRLHRAWNQRGCTRSGTTSCCSHRSICFSRKSTGLGCQASLRAHSVALFSVSPVPSACSTGCLAQLVGACLLLSQNSFPTAFRPSFSMSLSHHIPAPNLRSWFLGFLGLYPSYTSF